MSLKRRMWMDAMRAHGFDFRTIDHHDKSAWRGAVYAPDGALLTSCVVVTTDAGTPHEGVVVFWCSEGPRMDDDVNYLKSLVEARQKGTS